MRIATFNILSGRSRADDQVDTGRFIQAVTSLDADILGLQEVDRNQPRSRHADLTAIAAEAMGAPEHRFVAALRGTPGAIWSAATGEEQPDDAAYGVALLSRYPVAGWRVVRLPAMRTPMPFRFHGQVWPEWVRDEPRVAVVAEVDSPHGRIHVASTHLSYMPWWNGVQLRRLLRGLGEPAEPLVLVGDLNMGRHRAERITRLRPLATGLTFPNHRPIEQIDHILASDGLTASGGGSVEMPMSDHRALVADVETA